MALKNNSLKYNSEKFDSSANTFRKIYSNPVIDNFRGSVILPLDFSLEMDGIGGIIPHSAFEIPTDSLPSNYIVKTGDSKGLSKIAFILHTIDHNFNNNKWTTKITGQTLSIRYDELTEEQKNSLLKLKQIQHSTSSIERSSIRGLASGAVPADVLYLEIGINAKQWDIYRNGIAFIESSNRGYNIKGGFNDHYDGRYQLGKDAKTDGAKTARIPDPGHDEASRDKFRKNPQLQEKIFTGFTVNNHRFLIKNPKYLNSSIERKLEILGYAHNQGAGAANSWLNTNIIGTDGFGTKGTKYSDIIANNFLNSR
jgi:hypothetical protein